MSNNYDNWEKLVEAVLKREDLRRTALLDESRESSFNSISSDFSFGSSSNTASELQKIVVRVDFKDVRMKQTFMKAVLRLLKLHDEEAERVRKALVQLTGVESVALKGNQVEVVGDGIDAVVLMRALRKCVASADLISVGEAKKIILTIRLSTNNEKSRSKALKTIVGVSGVESVALNGNQVKVDGDGIDAVVLMRALRKCVASADLISVSEANTTPAPPVVPASPVAWSSFPQPYFPDYEHPSPDPSCTIM